jgi:glucose/arabinose dehydrogenase
LHPRYHIAAALAGILLFAARLAAAVLLPTGFVNDTLLTGLTEPTSMAFLPDGRLLITEQRTGKLRMFVNGHLAASDPVWVAPNLIADTYERGFQGVAVDPGWPARPYVYLYYNRIGGFCRLVRYRASGNLSNPAGENLALGDSLLLLDDIPDNNGNHNSGCLRFGPGNYLFASLGDDEFRCGSGDSTSLRGQILRLDVSRLPDRAGGQVPRTLITPATNPLSTADSNARLVWAYGLRNPWRYVIDPITGALYTAEVGLDLYDELDEILPGDFLGWPWREGPLVEYVGSCPEPGGMGVNDYKAPLVALPHDGMHPQAVNTAGMYRAVPGAPHNWPQSYAGFYGDVFYGEYYSGYLRRLKKVSGVWGTPPAAPGQPNATDWATGLTSAVEFLVGPDGSLWWLAQFDATYENGTGMLQRIRWTDVTLSVTGDDAPRAALAAAPNPFRDATRIALRLPARETVSLGLYDLSGRRVRVLFRGEAPAGESDFDWDGRDDLGRPAGAGVYFARVESAGAAPRATALLRLK